MRVAILGAGAMGSWFGGQLAQQGHDVQLLTTNNAHIEAVSANGLLMHVHGDTDNVTTVKVAAGTPADYDGTADLIIVLTKSYQTTTALHSVAAQLKERTAVLTLQNGLGNAEAIAAFVKPENIWIGMSMMPVDRIAPGVIASRGTGQTTFGRFDATHHAFGDAVAQAFEGCGISVRHDPDVKTRIWEKVAFNAGMNALCALTYGTPGTIGQLPDAGTLIRAVATEVADVASAEGVPVSLDAVFETIAYACENHGGHKASMLQDLQNGKRTEVDALNGAIVDLGQRQGVPTPLNATLATLVRLAELGDHSQTDAVVS
ncbi:MAG: ketopantoate reductase family protein [Granulosicoccus sp.]